MIELYLNGEKAGKEYLVLYITEYETSIQIRFWCAKRGMFYYSDKLLDKVFQTGVSITFVFLITAFIENMVWAVRLAEITILVKFANKEKFCEKFSVQKTLQDV